MLSPYIFLFYIFIYFKRIESLNFLSNRASSSIYNKKLAIEQNNHVKLKSQILHSTQGDAITIETPKREINIPSFLELLKYGIPTLGIWLLQPILSLIDTAVIGKFCY